MKVKQIISLGIDVSMSISERNKMYVQGGVPEKKPTRENGGGIHVAKGYVHLAAPFLPQPNGLTLEELENRGPTQK